MDLVGKEFTDEHMHWLIIEQISHNERVNNPRDIDILYEEIFKAIKQICQNKRK